MDTSQYGLNPAMNHLGHHYYPDSSRHSSYFNFYQYQNTYPEHQHHQHQASPPRDYSPESESSQMSPSGLPPQGGGLTPDSLGIHGSHHPHHDFHSHYYAFSQYSGSGQIDPVSGCPPPMLLDAPSQSGSPGLARFGGLTSSMGDLSRSSGLMMMGGSEKRSVSVNGGAGGKLPTGSNKKERRRTQSINNAFASLRDCIPNVPCDTKLSKIKTLRLATSYIDYLMQMLNSENTSSGKIFEFDFLCNVTKSLCAANELRCSLIAWVLRLHQTI